MIAESIRYLHKSISALKNERTIFSNVLRIAPIVTVISGLLDAGVSPEEPLLQSGLGFLAKFHQEQKRRKSVLSKDDSVLLRQIAVCLKKAKKPVSRPARGESISPDFFAGLVVSPGVNASLRIRHLNQPSLKKLIPTEEILTDSFSCHLLIAAVHGLQSFPIPLPRPPLPPQPPSESLAWLVPFFPLKDRKETESTSGNSSLVPVCPATFHCSVLYKLESESRLFADNFRLLRSTQRLE